MEYFDDDKVQKEKKVQVEDFLKGLVINNDQDADDGTPGDHEEVKTELEAPAGLIEQWLTSGDEIAGEDRFLKA